MGAERQSWCQPERRRLVTIHDYSFSYVYSYEIYSSIFSIPFYTFWISDILDFFILDLDTICIIYISILYCSFLGSIPRMVPSALLDASLSFYTNFFRVYVYAFTYCIGENCSK